MNPPMSADEIATVFDSELIGFLVHRYKKSVSEIISQFFIQNEQADSSSGPRRESDFMLEGNEMEILRAYYNSRT